MGRGAATEGMGGLRYNEKTASVAARSGQRAPGIHAEDALDHAMLRSAAHADHVVVQVDRGVAVPRNQPQHAANGGQQRLAACGGQDAVFIAPLL